MTKTFGITKTGYSAGVYGCSAEYFTCVFTDSEGMHSFRFHGLYGAESRVAGLMKDRGYKEFYISSSYGQCKAREAQKGSYSEYVVEKNITELIKHGYIES